MGSLIVLLTALLSCGTTLFVGFKLRGRVNEVKFNVDGRLENAMVRIDTLEGMVSTLAGTQVPPPVSKQDPAVTAANVQKILPTTP